MNDAREFRKQLKVEFEEFVARQRRRFPEAETARVDLHCHDRNSDVPDELLGRLLRAPETWTTTDEVLAALETAGTDLVTITNHNNARSCYALQDRGVDVLVGAEFSCLLPELDVTLHVLAYGFEPSEEAELLSRRKNLYRFLEYAVERDLPTVLAHPLYFYAPASMPTLAFIEKLTLLFDNFEVINGQRDSWQNLLLATWIEGLDVERLDAISRRVGLRPSDFSRRPFHKAMTGGSDCHMGIFVGGTGTLFHIPEFQARRRSVLGSKLVLDALREGRMAPYGTYTGAEKLTASFLDFFCQMTLHLEDPGLLRILLHKGEAKDKLQAALIANGVFELRRHGYTSRFLKTAHDALHGKRPSFVVRQTTKRDYQPLLAELGEIAAARQQGPAEFQRQIGESFPTLFHSLSELLASRITAKVESAGWHKATSRESAIEAIRKLELPLHLRGLLDGDEAPQQETGLRSVAAWTDGLPFPLLAAAVLQGAAFASAKVMYANRPLLDEFSSAIGKHGHPRRALWLTDTFFDRNGVATALQLVHREVKARDLPIDFAVVHDVLDSGDHLHVLRPIAELSLPFYQEQPIRIFDLAELQRIFVDGGYDRIVCSTELWMGLAALFLKHAYSVPAQFYLHTDWLDFARRTLGFDEHNVDRVRRLLRAFYGAFDGVFVLNSEQRDWLTSSEIGLPAARVHNTAHWIGDEFAAAARRAGSDLERVEHGPVMLFAGRLSEEKGVFELPALFRRLRERIPGLSLTIAGVGPAKAQLEALLPEATFTGWVDAQHLALAYTAADLLVLPSRFDTFGNVVLEALHCGLPVVAYDTKGPRDIIVHGECGLLARDEQEFAAHAESILTDRELRDRMRAAGRTRAACYERAAILSDLLWDMGLGGEVLTGPADTNEGDGPHPSRTGKPPCDAAALQSIG